MGLFSDLFGGVSTTALGSNWQNVLKDWLQGKSFGGAGGKDVENALSQLFSSTNTAVNQGTPFYESLIPSAPGALSPAAAAEKSAATDALQSSLGSAGVSQLGQLNREYGGRLPASMVQSGFGNLARAGAQGSTDIARNAILENVNLGEQGVQGLAGLASLSGMPLGTVSPMMTSGATAGMYNTPGIIPSLANSAKSISGAIAGFAGLGSGGGSNLASFGLPGQSNQNIQQLPLGNTLPNGQPRQYLPLGGLS